MRVYTRILFAGLLTTFGCATNERALTPYRGPEELNWIHKQVETASLADGVDQDEANRLARSYWIRFGSRCGRIDSVRDSRDCWKAPVFVGMFGARKGDILVHKTTGYISWKGGPTVTNWSQLWQ
jgi:hypothetical protein